MKRIGIIGAMEEEVNILKEKMQVEKVEKKAGMEFFQGTLSGKDVVIVRSGIGKVNAAICTQILADDFSVEGIINTGVAGALNKQINIGDIVVSSSVVHHDANIIEDEGKESGMLFPRGTIQFSDESITKIDADKALADRLIEGCKNIDGVKVFYGTVASGEQFISSKVARIEIGEFFNAYCCEMEGAAIGQVCYRNDVPFVILRAISDTIDDNDFMDFEKFKCIAADETLKVIKAFFNVEEK